LSDGQVLGYIVSALTGFSIAIGAEPLRQRLFAPRLQLAFGATEDFITHTPVQMGGIPAGEETYVRVGVKNASFPLAKKCRAFLTEVHRVGDDGELLPTPYCESIQLAWAVRDKPDDYGPQDLAHGVPYFFDVVSLANNVNIVSPKVHQLPLRYDPIFEGYGTYQFGVMVAGDGVRPVHLNIRLTWRGDRSAIIAESVPSATDPAVRLPTLPAAAVPD
jgi:hypothetical protein